MEGGTAHGWNNSTCVSLGAPLPPYIKEQGGRPAGPPMVRLGCNPTRNRIAILFLVGTTKEGRRGKEREKERERGAAPPSPCPIRTPPREGAHHLLAAALSLHYGPPGPIIPPGGSGNPPGTPVNSETFQNTSGVRI